MTNYEGHFPDVFQGKLMKIDGGFRELIRRS
jgi:hypothetical protein